MNRIEALDAVQIILDQVEALKSKMEDLGHATDIEQDVAESAAEALGAAWVDLVDAEQVLDLDDDDMMDTAEMDDDVDVPLLDDDEDGD